MEELYEEYSKIVYHFLCSLCRDAMLAEELTQETFLQAFCRLSGMTAAVNCRFGCVRLPNICTISILERQGGKYRQSRASFPSQKLRTTQNRPRSQSLSS